MSSQYGEHEFILKHFAGQSGTFLDIGAFDGTTFSNTWPLAQAGWSGVCVEPSPPAFCHLMKSYAGNPLVKLVNAAVAADATPRLRRFDCNTSDSLSADMMSTFDPAQMGKWAGHPFREIAIPVITPPDLFRYVGNKFDFVNIDVEGMNLEVLQDVGHYIDPVCSMICVELDPLNEQPVFEHWFWEVGLTNTKVIGGNLLGWK